MVRYFVWLLAIFGLIIILIVLLLPGGHKATTPKSLPSYATTDAISRLIIDGPINANQLHQAVQIDVGQNNVTYEQLSGYNGQVVNQQTFSNTEAAYDNFLHALNLAGFTLGNKDPKLSDERGYCPLGDRYVFELINNGTTLERFWATNCSGLHTYQGNTALSLILFQNQVPNYSTLIENVTL